MKRSEAVSHAVQYGVCSLLEVSNPKTRKGEKQGWLTAVMHLAPSNRSQVMNVCPYSSPGCRAACLNTAGRGKMMPVQQARVRKTVFFKQQSEAFLELLFRDVESMVRKAARLGMRLAVRLNGTSDLRWERIVPTLFAAFPDVQFYDYTKDASRMRKSHKLPDNYDLTFSRDETNEKAVRRVLAAGGRVAVVFKYPPPATYAGYPVVMGEDSDLRFLDGNSVVVGLRAKGRALRDESGFVVKQTGVFDKLGSVLSVKIERKVRV